MPTEAGRIRCQRCRAANPYANDACARCGTPLMLVTVSPAQRFEDMTTSEPHGDHLLERISLIENRLDRLMQIMERSIDGARQQAEATSKICELIGNLAGLVDEMRTEGLTKAAEPAAGEPAEKRRAKRATTPARKKAEIAPSPRRRPRRERTE